MIQISPAGATAETTTLDAPLEHLMACHRRIEDRLATLERAATALEARPTEALAAIQSAFAFMDSNGAIHTRDEEESLFPRLSGRIPPAGASLIAALEAEHQQAERIYRHLGEITDRIQAGDATATPEFAPAAAALCALYRKHIATEDSQLMDVARGSLTADDLSAISGEMKARRGLV